MDREFETKFQSKLEKIIDESDPNNKFYYSLDA